MINEEIITKVIKENDWVTSAHLPGSIDEWSFVDKMSLGRAVLKALSEDVRQLLIDDSNGHISGFVFYTEFADDIIEKLEPQLYLIWSARYDEDLADRTAIVGW